MVQELLFKPYQETLMMPLTGSLFLQDSQCSCSLGSLSLCPGMAQAVQGCACVAAEQQRGTGSEGGQGGRASEPTPSQHCPVSNPSWGWAATDLSLHFFYLCIAVTDAHKSSLGVTEAVSCRSTSQNARFPSGKGGKERVQMLPWFHA